MAVSVVDMEKKDRDIFLSLCKCINVFQRAAREIYMYVLVRFRDGLASPRGGKGRGVGSRDY